jgi:tRNA dimethylallyltransferase
VTDLAKGILVISGPTATGKTAAAIEVAKRWPVQIISADAMQVYRGMDIGTAKEPSEVLRDYPHACLSVREPHELYSATDFAADADEAIAEAHSCGKRVVVVGGTGFYLRALLEGLVEAPSADLEMRKRLEALENPHAELALLDPELAEKLHPNDHLRIIRGIEVYQLTGKTLSSLHSEHNPTPRYPSVRLWLDRDDIKERINMRVLAMMNAGYLDEVRRLLEMGVSRNCKPMKSLGYKHLSAYIAGEIPLEEAVRLTQRDTRHFVKKQRLMLKSVGGFEKIEQNHVEAVLAAASSVFGEMASVTVV